MRNETICPICGNTEFIGNTCKICGYEKSPIINIELLIYSILAIAGTISYLWFSYGNIYFILLVRGFFEEILLEQIESASPLLRIISLPSAVSLGLAALALTLYDLLMRPERKEFIKNDKSIKLSMYLLFFVILFMFFILPPTDMIASFLGVSNPIAEWIAIFLFILVVFLYTKDARLTILERKKSGLSEGEFIRTIIARDAFSIVMNFFVYSAFLLILVYALFTDILLGEPLYVVPYLNIEFILLSMYIFFVEIVYMLYIVYSIVLKPYIMLHTKKRSNQVPPYVVERINQLLSEHNLLNNSVSVVFTDENIPSPYTFGVLKQYLVIPAGLVQLFIMGKLNEAEFDAVIYHEIAHINHKDSLLLAIFASPTKFLGTMLSYFLKAVLLIGVIVGIEVLYIGLDVLENLSFAIDFYAGLSYTFAPYILLSLSQNLLVNTLSRKREYVADLYSRIRIGVDPIKRALLKLSHIKVIQKHTPNYFLSFGSMELSFNSETLNKILRFVLEVPILANLARHLLLTHPSVTDRVKNIEFKKLDDRVTFFNRETLLFVSISLYPIVYMLTRIYKGLYYLLASPIIHSWYFEQTLLTDIALITAFYNIFIGMFLGYVVYRYIRVIRFKYIDKVLHGYYKIPLSKLGIKKMFANVIFFLLFASYTANSIKEITFWWDIRVLYPSRIVIHTILLNLAFSILFAILFYTMYVHLYYFYLAQETKNKSNSAYNKYFEKMYRHTKLMLFSVLILTLLICYLYIGIEVALALGHYQYVFLTVTPLTSLFSDWILTHTTDFWRHITGAELIPQNVLFFNEILIWSIISLIIYLYLFITHILQEKKVLPKLKDI